ncbi:MAG: hypothetical protein WBA46_06565, partial [Thermomicrobiales bacterium]
MPRFAERESRLSRRQVTASLAAAGTTAAVLGRHAGAATAATPEASPGASPEASPVAVMTPDPNAPFSTVSTPRDEALKAAIAAAHVTLDEPTATGGDLIELRGADAAILNPILRQ